MRGDHAAIRGPRAADRTYGVTGVALISFILVAVKDPTVQVQLLVWIFAMRITMVVVSALSYWANEAVQKGVIARTAKVNFESPLTWLVWITSLASLALTFVVSNLLIKDLGDGTLWWKLSAIISCGTLAGAIIPELIKVFTRPPRFTSPKVTSSREGGASLTCCPV